MRVIFALLILTLACTTLPTRALEIGDAAPPLSIAEWAKGEPVTMQKGSVYVLDFWATWCAPCIRIIPHTSDIQTKYKDKGVTIIAISKEPAGKVKGFVGGVGKRMLYTVAIDDGGKTDSAYQGGFKVNSIPHAYVIDKEGKIAWHGHPAAGLEEAIEAALAEKPE